MGALKYIAAIRTSRRRATAALIAELLGTEGRIAKHVRGAEHILIKNVLFASVVGRKELKLVLLVEVIWMVLLSRGLVCVLVMEIVVVLVMKIVVLLVSVRVGTSMRRVCKGVRSVKESVVGGRLEVALAEE